MKIGFSVTENRGDDSPLDGRFGRAGGFLVYDDAAASWQWIDNTQNVNSPSGAGIQSAQMMINAGVASFVGVHLGPKAFQVFQQARIALYQGISGLTAAANLEKLKNGLLEELKEANSVGF